MSIAELKEKIYEKINQLEDEDALQQVLEVLDVTRNNEKKINSAKHIDRLFKKHDGLLKRLF